LDGEDTFGQVPLAIAASVNRFEIVQYLIQQGWDPNRTQKDGNNAVSIAVVNKHYDIALYLLHQGGTLAIAKTLHPDEVEAFHNLWDDDDDYKHWPSCSNSY